MVVLNELQFPISHELQHSRHLCRHLALVKSNLTKIQKDCSFHKGKIRKNEYLCKSLCVIRLTQLRTQIGIYFASPSIYYRAAWTRDCLHVIFPFLGSDDSVQTLQSLLNKYKNDEKNIDKIILNPNNMHPYEHPHPKFCAKTTKNIHSESDGWGFLQNDAIGQMLYVIGIIIQIGRKDIISDSKDLEIIQKLINYQIAINYPRFYDNGVWEEQPKLNISSIVSVVAGLEKIKEVQQLLNNIANERGYKTRVEVPQEGINIGKAALYEFLTENSFELDPIETPSINSWGKRESDLALLFLPVMGMTDKDFTKKIIKKVEENLLRNRGVIRYKGDAYYNRSKNDVPDQIKVSPEHCDKLEGYEAEWTMGLPYLAIACQLVSETAAKEGDFSEAEAFQEKAQRYLQQSQKVMTIKGMPELYYSGTNFYNVNTPLGWANAMYVLAQKFIKGEINYIRLRDDLKEYLS